jgi:hypothetical protein
MPDVAIGTYLPCWGAPQHRVAGDDEDAITLAVEAGRAALIASGAAERVVRVMGADKLRDTTSADMLWEWEAMARDMAWDYPLGLVSPAGFAQLRGEAANQVDGARVALAHNIGGPTAVSAVTILEGSASGTG